MAHLALTRVTLTCICMVSATVTVTSHESVSPSAAASCTDEQVKEFDGQSSLIQLNTGSSSQTDVDDISNHESNLEATQPNAKEQANAEGGLSVPDPRKVTFNCKIGLVHWIKGWSDLKKHYCCRTEHVGCIDATDTTEETTGDDQYRSRRRKSERHRDTSKANTSETCVTVNSEASILGYTTSPANTPCIFGLDKRDEGKHCILDDMRYGSLGWCYTSKSLESWGPCSESCPLFGQLKVLGNKVDKLRTEVKELFNLTAGSNASDAGESTAAPKPAKEKNAPAPTPAGTKSPATKAPAPTLAPAPAANAPTPTPAAPATATNTTSATDNATSATAAR